MTAVENKIPDVSNIIKSFTTADFNKFTSQKLDAKIKQKGLVDKSAIAEFINNADLDKKVATLATTDQKLFSM